jgi:hypothetical protein
MVLISGPISDADEARFKHAKFSAVLHTPAAEEALEQVMRVR